MTNWKEIAERYKFLLSIKTKECDYWKSAHTELLDALANPDKYLDENLEANNEL